jgi:hypothetical protein
VKGERCRGERKYVGLIVHDMRRSAARNMLRAGVRERVVMDAGGWLTPSMLDRYAIRNLADQREAMMKLDQARQQLNLSTTPLRPSDTQSDEGKEASLIQ